MLGCRPFLIQALNLLQGALRNNLQLFPSRSQCGFNCINCFRIASTTVLFFWFLKRQKKEKKKAIRKIKKVCLQRWIFYEAPHRLKETLKHMHEVLGDRKIVLCRELTKKFEEFIRGTISEAN